MPFKFGNTYKEDCDVCIDDFMRNTQEHDTKVHTLRKAQTQIKQLRPMAGEDTVIKRLNQYRDRHPTSKIMLGEYINFPLFWQFLFHFIFTKQKTSTLH